MALGSFSKDKIPLPVPRPTGGAWHNSSRLEHTQVIRKALTFQLRLENAVHDAARLSQTDANTGTSELQRLSSELAASSAGLHDFFSDFASTALHNELRRGDSCPARRVFDIAEIVEMILGYLDTIELLQVLQVDRTLYQTIESSPLLQEKLYLRPAPDAHLSVPFLASPNSLRQKGLKKRKYHPLPGPGFPCFTCRIGPDAGTGLAAISAEFSQKLPRLGKRSRSMLICQPPIHTMGVYASCCSLDPYEVGIGCGLTPEARPRNFTLGDEEPGQVFEPPFDTITSQSGITVGDLYDMTIKVRKVHDRCPWAPMLQHDNEGAVSNKVSFGGAIKLQPDDPVMDFGPFVNLGPISALPPCTDMGWPADWEMYSPRRPCELLNRYAAAKRRAYSNGEPRPSFQEFKDGIDPVTGLYPSEDTSDVL